MWMQELDDIALLREYVDHDSEEAFATLVTRHVNKVYSVALRHTRNPHQAEEITQAVFVILAKKSRHLGRSVVLSGWLYQTARLAAMTFIRSEIRRARREQEAQMQTLLNETESDVWTQIAPLLDTAMAGLNEKDRYAVVLRFFDGKSMREVGAALGGSEDAAKTRLNRAVEKLRQFFVKRGIASTAESITGAIAANSVQAAPAALAKSVTAVALAKGAAASSSTLTLIKGALKIMAWTKVKTAIVSGVVVLLAAGTTTVTVKEIQEHRTQPWQINEGEITGFQLNQPPQVRILPSKFHKHAEGIVGNMVGTGLGAEEVIAAAFSGSFSSARVISHAELPAGRYDYIATLPGGQTANEKALQEEVRRKFGVVGKTEIRAADVLLLKVKFTNAPGLKLNTKGAWPKQSSGIEPVSSELSRGFNEPIIGLIAGFENEANVPVIDGTGLTNLYDFDLKCSQADLKNRNWDKVNRALDPLGLELVPTNMPIKMLVVEKAK
jgi:uncharacterized protein (TIGR03435 family)